MRRGALRLLGAAIALCAASACSPLHSAVSSTSMTPVVGPHVIQRGQVPVTWTQFVPSLSCGSGLPLTSIVVGPDHKMWLADPCGGLIQMTMAGAITEHLFSDFKPTQIAVGADHRFYMTQQATGVIGASDSNGNLQTYAIPSGDTVYDGGIALGPDGNVWFVEQQHVGKITPGGTISEYLDYQFQTGFNKNAGVAAGADGHVYVPDPEAFDSGAVLDIDPSSGQIYYADFDCRTGGPAIPVAQPSNSLVWYMCTDVPRLIELSGLTRFESFSTIWPLAGGTSALPQAMIAGPKGDPWWASTGGVIAWFDSRSDAVTAYIPPDQNEATDAIAFGPDGNIWGATADGKVEVYIINVLSVEPASLAFGGIGQQQILNVSERGHQSWAASSSDASVATVAQGGSASQFVVTSVGTGSCTVTVTDHRHNFFPVPVTVGQVENRAER